MPGRGRSAVLQNGFAEQLPQCGAVVASPHRHAGGGQTAVPWQCPPQRCVFCDSCPRPGRIRLTMPAPRRYVFRWEKPLMRPRRTRPARQAVRCRPRGLLLLCFALSAGDSRFVPVRPVVFARGEALPTNLQPVSLLFFFFPSFDGIMNLYNRIKGAAAQCSPASVRTLDDM